MGVGPSAEDKKKLLKENEAALSTALDQYRQRLDDLSRQCSDCADRSDFVGFMDNMCGLCSLLNDYRNHMAKDKLSLNIEDDILIEACLSFLKDLETQFIAFSIPWETAKKSSGYLHSKIEYKTVADIFVYREKIFAKYGKPLEDKLNDIRRDKLDIALSTGTGLISALERETDISVCPDVALFDPSTKHVSVGDLHGNALKLIYTLIQEGVLSLDKAQYQRLYSIYSAPLTSASLAEFKSIIASAHCNDARSLTLIGDVLCDRGANDYLTLLVLKKLKDSSVDFDILLSNHDMEFIRDYERLRFTGESNLAYTQDASLKNMMQLITDGLITDNEIRELVADAYIPAVKAIGYTVSADKREISIFTHAPVGLETIQKLAEKFSIPYHEDTIDELVNTIDAINDHINHLLKRNELAHIPSDERASLSADLQADYDDRIISPDLPLSRLIWSGCPKGIRTTALTGKPLPYSISFIHGHVGQNASPMHPRYINLDANFGKGSDGKRTSASIKHRVRHSPQMTANQMKREAHVDLVGSLPGDAPLFDPLVVLSEVFAKQETLITDIFVQMKVAQADDLKNGIHQLNCVHRLMFELKYHFDNLEKTHRNGVEGVAYLERLAFINRRVDWVKCYLASVVRSDDVEHSIKLEKIRQMEGALSSRIDALRLFVAPTDLVATPSPKASIPTAPAVAPTPKASMPTAPVVAPTSKASMPTAPVVAPTPKASMPTAPVVAPTPKASIPTAAAVALTPTVSKPTAPVVAPTPKASIPTAPVVALTPSASKLTAPVAAPTDLVRKDIKALGRKPGQFVLITNSYFSPTGSLNQYIQEREQAFWFRDLLSNCIAVLFGCFGYKTEARVRRDYVCEVIDCANQFSSNQKKENLDTLKAKILNGISLFSPRSYDPNSLEYQHSMWTKFTIGSSEYHAVEYKKSLRYLLVKIQNELDDFTMGFDEPNTVASSLAYVG